MIGTGFIGPAHVEALKRLGVNVEIMCWPMGKAERRYAGVTHIDVVGLTETRACQILELTESAGVSISGLGYYPNPLAPDSGEARVYPEYPFPPVHVVGGCI